MRINLLVHNRALFAGELAAECKDVSIDAAIQREMLQKKQPVKQCKAAESKPVNLEDSTVCSYACIYTCMHACMHTYVRTYTHIYVHTHTHKHVKTHTHTFVSGCKCMYVCMHACMYIFMYVDTEVCTFFSLCSSTDC